MVHPCCRLISLQSASKAIAIIDAVGGMFGAVTASMIALTLVFFRREIELELENDASLDSNIELKRFMEQPESVQYSMIGFTILICILEVIVALILFKGARTRNAFKCSIWFRVHLILLLFAILFTVVAVITSAEKTMISIAGGVGLIYQIYTIWIVKAFVQEVKGGRQALPLDLDDEQGEPLQVIKRT